MTADDSPLERFFAMECDAHVRRVLLEEAETRIAGSRYFTFNVFNVRLDMDNGTATVEDELDPKLSTATSLAEFVARLREPSTFANPS